MPPFNPKQLMPVPAPTAPTAKSSAAAAMAASTSASVTAIAWMSFRKPSLHSSTTALTVAVCRPVSGSAAMARRISALAQVPTAKVLVSRIGVSSTPSSLTCIRPTLLPKPFSTTAAATGLSWNRSPSCGSTAVTPVRISPSISVAWPTSTPGTSAMLLRSPGGSTPQARPRSRARIDRSDREVAVYHGMAGRPAGYRPASATNGLQRHCLCWGLGREVDHGGQSP